MTSGSPSPEGATTTGSWRQFVAEARLRDLDRRRLWSEWTDPARWARWDRGLASARLLEPGFSEGAHGEIVDHSGRRSNFVVTHTADDRSVVAYSVRLPGARLVVTRSVVVGPGATTIRHHVEFRGPAGGIFALVLGRQFRALVGPSLEALIAELEHPRSHEAH